MTVSRDNRILPNFSAIQGTNYGVLYTVATDVFIDSDSDSDVLSYTISGLPTGINFNKTSMYLYGTPYLSQTSGDYTIKFSAGNANGIDNQDVTCHLCTKGSYTIPSIAPSSQTGDIKLNWVNSATFGSQYTVTDDNIQNPAFSIVWSSDNARDDAYGTNRSPISINSSGQLYASDNIEKTQYSIIVEAKDNTSPVSLTKAAKGTFSFTPNAPGDAIIVINIF